MKSVFALAFVVAIVPACTSTSAMSDEPVRAATPLSTDEVAIYTAVLRYYSDNHDIALNVSQNTYPLDLNSPMHHLQAECLKGIQLENLAIVSRSFHQLCPRGGIPIDVFWQTGSLPKGMWVPDQGVAPYRGRG